MHNGNTLTTGAIASQENKMKSKSIKYLTTLLALSPIALATSMAFAGGDISFHAKEAYPESVSWSASQKVFMVSSVKQGVVGKLTTDGKYTPFIFDSNLVSSVGLKVDDKRNTLWVTNSDPGVGARTATATQGKLAGVASYNATTGKPLAYYDLGKLTEGTHFANDLTLDAEGNVYVTDSFSPVIYKITKAGKTSVFAQSDMFKGEGFNLNGIAWHQDGYLLVGKYNSGELFRVNIKNPTEITHIQLQSPLKGADGFHLIEGNRLVIVQNLGADRTVQLVSTDGWKTASIEREKKSLKSMPTAATQAGDSVYVLNASFDTLFNKDAPKVSNYILQKF